MRTFRTAVYIAGGISAAGISSRVFGGKVYVAGGGSGAIYRLGSPVVRVGSLRVQNGAAVSLPGAALVIGGHSATGTTAAVYRVSARG